MNSPSSAFPAALALVLVLRAFAAAAAEGPAPSAGCEDAWLDTRGHNAVVCEIRELTFRPPRAFAVDAGPSGSVHVTGWDEDHVLVRAIVHTWGDDEAQARAAAERVVLRTGDLVRAYGADRRGAPAWSVSYEIFAPFETHLGLTTREGAISVEGIRGRLAFETVNGRVEVDGVEILETASNPRPASGIYAVQ